MATREGIKEKELVSKTMLIPQEEMLEKMSRGKKLKLAFLQIFPKWNTGFLSLHRGLICLHHTGTRFLLNRMPGR